MQKETLVPGVSKPKYNPNPGLFSHPTVQPHLNQLLSSVACFQRPTETSFRFPSRSMQFYAMSMKMMKLNGTVLPRQPTLTTRATQKVICSDPQLMCLRLTHSQFVSLWSGSGEVQNKVRPAPWSHYMVQFVCICVHIIHKCIHKPRGSLPGPVGACDFLLENECCIN